MTDPTPTRNEAQSMGNAQALEIAESVFQDAISRRVVGGDYEERALGTIKAALQAQSITPEDDDLTTVYMVGVHDERKRIEKAVEGLRRVKSQDGWQSEWEQARAQGWNAALDAVIRAIKTNSSAGGE